MKLFVQEDDELQELFLKKYGDRFTQDSWHYHPKDRAITYKADFIVFNKDGTYKIVDVKGFESQQWKRTAKQFRLKFPELELCIEKWLGK